MKRNDLGTKNKKLIVIIVLLIIVLLGGGVFSYLTISNLQKRAAEDTSALQNKLTSVTRSGYVAVVDIKMGDVVTENMLEYKSDLSSDADQGLFITKSDIGKVATITIPAGTPIFTNMVSVELAQDYHEKECSFIWLSTNLEANDYVDVRILFPNGEDYIVAAKKCIKNPLISANNVFLWLTEEEIQSLDAAVVDANLHNAKIYTTKYVKPEVQEASIANYEPNADVMRVMQSDPNIVTASARALSAEARAALENRIKLFEQAYPDFVLNEYATRDNTNGVISETTDSTESGSLNSGSDSKSSLNSGSDSKSSLSSDKSTGSTKSLNQSSAGSLNGDSATTSSVTSESSNSANSAGSVSGTGTTSGNKEDSISYVK